MPPCRFNHSSNLLVPIANCVSQQAAGNRPPTSYPRKGWHLPFLTRFFSDASPPPDLKLENGIPVPIAILLSAAFMRKGIFVVILRLTRLILGGHECHRTEFQVSLRLGTKALQMPLVRAATETLKPMAVKSPDSGSMLTSPTFPVTSTSPSTPEVNILTNPRRGL